MEVGHEFWADLLAEEQEGTKKLMFYFLLFSKLVKMDVILLF
jgi:hypothetical protein